MTRLAYQPNPATRQDSYSLPGSAAKFCNALGIAAAIALSLCLGEFVMITFSLHLGLATCILAVLYTTMFRCCDLLVKRRLKVRKNELKQIAPFFKFRSCSLRDVEIRSSEELADISV